MLAIERMLRHLSAEALEKVLLPLVRTVVLLEGARLTPGIHRPNEPQRVVVALRHLIDELVLRLSERGHATLRRALASLATRASAASTLTLTCSTGLPNARSMSPKYDCEEGSLT